MSDRKWTVDDVQQLVEAASSVLNDEHTKLRGSLWHELRTALAPFQPDPDAELVEAMAEAIFVLHAQAHWGTWENASPDDRRMSYDTARAALAAVRDHDAKAVAK